MRDVVPFGALQDLLYKFRSWNSTSPRGEVPALRQCWPSSCSPSPLPRGSTGSRSCAPPDARSGIPWVAMDAGIRGMTGSLFLVKNRHPAVASGRILDGQAPLLPGGLPLGRSSRCSTGPASCSSPGTPTAAPLREMPEDLPGRLRPDRKAVDPECLRCLDCTRCPSLKVTTVFHARPFATPEIRGGISPDKGRRKWPTRRRGTDRAGGEMGDRSREAESPGGFPDLPHHDPDAHQDLHERLRDPYRHRAAHLGAPGDRARNSSTTPRWG